MRILKLKCEFEFLQSRGDKRKLNFSSSYRLSNIFKKPCDY